MTPSSARLGAVAVALLCLTAGPGCKKSVNTVAVAGKVTLDGSAVTSGQVTFTPLDEGAAKELSAGTIDANGNYTIKTGGKDGAPPGKYQVSITPAMSGPMGDGKSMTLPFPEKYTTPRNTPLTIEVVASPAPGAYDLKMVSDKK